MKQLMWRVSTPCNAGSLALIHPKSFQSLLSNRITIQSFLVYTSNPVTGCNMPINSHLRRKSMSKFMRIPALEQS